MGRTILTVFLSSTGKDLDAYRDAVHKRITANEFLKCVRMEDFGPQNAGAVAYCEQQARACDFFVGIVGLRRGWEPDGDNRRRSITEMEYDSANEAARERLMCIAPDDFPVPGNLREADDVHDRQAAFRRRVGSELVSGVHNFTSPEALAGEVIDAILSRIISGQWIKELRPDLAGTDASQALAPLVSALETLGEDDDADLLSLARNPEGADIEALEEKLRARAERAEADGRQRAAIYWRHIGALAFLHDTGAALAAYRKATELDPDDANGWNQLGHLYQRSGGLDDAVAAYHRVLALGNAGADNGTIAAATGNLGNVFRTRGDLDTAEEMHRKALALDEALGRKEGMANAYGNLGIVFAMRGDLDKAEAMVRESLAIEEALGRKEGMASDYMNLGVLEKSRGNVPAACVHWTTALSLYREIGMPHMVAKIEDGMREAGCGASGA